MVSGGPSEPCGRCRLAQSELEELVDAVDEPPDEELVVLEELVPESFAAVLPESEEEPVVEPARLEDDPERLSVR